MPSIIIKTFHHYFLKDKTLNSIYLKRNTDILHPVWESTNSRLKVQLHEGQTKGFKIDCQPAFVWRINGRHKPWGFIFDAEWNTQTVFSVFMEVYCLQFVEVCSMKRPKERQTIKACFRKMCVKVEERAEKIKTDFR